MIYDCFTFFNELELLEIRLNELNPYVDKFLIVESTYTFAGRSKKLNFDNSLFSDFVNKIIYIVVEDMPNNGNAWHNEFYQRNQIMRGLGTCEESDIIIISDLDEIPNLKFSLERLYDGKRYGFNQLFYYYYLNMKNTAENWIGSKCLSFSDLQKTTPQEVRMGGVDSLVKDGGWHFSYMGGIERIKYKLENGSHQEFKDLSKDHVISSIDLKKSMFDDRPSIFQVVPIDDTFPQYIFKNQDKFIEMLLDI